MQIVNNKLQCEKHVIRWTDVECIQECMCCVKKELYSEVFSRRLAVSSSSTL